MKRPNVLIIQTDQQSTWTLSCYGGTEISTPHIDSIANTGSLFDNFYTVSAVCTPSRGCFMSGQYPHTHGAYRNDVPIRPCVKTFAQIMKEKGLDLDTANDADRFFQGWTDACLAAQNMVTAAELAGYGTVYMGSILNDAEKMIEILNLPELTFPVVGLGLGMADQKPALKPRMPREANVFDDEYSTFDNYHELLEDYDEEMNQYYDLRSPNYPLPKFTDQVVGRLQMKDEKRSALVEIAKAQGFHL